MQPKHTNTMRRTAVTLSVMLALSGLVGLVISGCGGGSSAAASAANTIGAAGGSVSSTDSNVTLAFPAGALAQNTAITVQPIANPAAPPANAVMVAGTAYELGPTGMVFA